MRSIDARVGTIAASVLMTVLMFSGIALAQAEEVKSEDSPAIALLCLGPIFLLILPFVTLLQKFLCRRSRDGGRLCSLTIIRASYSEK